MTGWWSTAAGAVVFVSALAVVTTAAQSDDHVTVQKVMDDQVVVSRSNGATWLMKKGAGCSSLRRYEGKQVVVSSPALFPGAGSKLVIPDLGQECRIWSSERADSPGNATPTDEISFFDSHRRAAAYLDAAHNRTVYLWSGEAVAYLNEDSIYGFNGQHLGWYKDGMIFDHDGNVVVGPAAAFRKPVQSAAARAPKGLEPVKGPKELKPSQPLFASSWSDVPAREFFVR